MIEEKDCEQNRKEIYGEVNDIRVMIAELPEKLIEKLEKKFASKIVEKIVYAMITVICLGVLTTLLGTVVNAFQ